MVRQTLLHIIYSSQPTRWTERTRALRDRFGLPEATLVMVNPSREVVRAQVQRSEKAEWRGLATAKPSLEVYWPPQRDIYQARPPHSSLARASRRACRRLAPSVEAPKRLLRTWLSTAQTSSPPPALQPYISRFASPKRKPR
ncbi:hypothetical protein HPB48_016424 [Haemaphysalis longicornis]|uniref:Uncharacterized protein n=1 Tax=Haemaphysalis longicornis TaxID=44386 RepID=A0A9J6G871_HAELO|nr:hypothetical protein HPB48_016424 [Haemaphysalis longicornis]